GLERALLAQSEGSHWPCCGGWCLRRRLHVVSGAHGECHREASQNEGPNERQNECAAERGSQFTPGKGFAGERRRPEDPTDAAADRDKMACRRPLDHMCPSSPPADRPR